MSYIRISHPSFTDDEKTRQGVQAAKQQNQLSKHGFIFIEYNFFLLNLKESLKI